jgi:hypothetical protein
MHGVIPPPHPLYTFVAHTETTLQQVSKENRTYKHLCFRFHDSGDVTGCSGMAAWKKVGFVRGNKYKCEDVRQGQC